MPDTNYVQIGDEKANSGGLARWQKVGLALVIVGAVVGATYHYTNVATTAMANANETVSFLIFPAVANAPLWPWPNHEGANARVSPPLIGNHMSAIIENYNAGPSLGLFMLVRGIRYILEGELHLTDGTGQKVVARPGDFVWMPKNSYITCETPTTAKSLAILEWEGLSQPGAAEGMAAYEPWMKGPGSKNKMVLWPKIWDGNRPKGEVTHPQAWKEWAFDNLVSDNGFVAGMFGGKAGPPVEWESNEIFQYVTGGEFQLSDASGRQGVAKPGDLVLYPKGSRIRTFSWPAGFSIFCGLGGWFRPK